MLFLKVVRHLFFGGGLHHFFDSTSFKLTSSPPYRVPSGRIPLVKGAFADAVVAAKLSDLSTRFVLLEDADDLLLTESYLSHVHSPCSYFSWRTPL